MVLKNKHGAGEIRFSENEKRNLASIALSMFGQQVKLLAAIASATGVDKEEIDKIFKDKTSRIAYKHLIGEDDGSKPYDPDN